ncbi:FABP family protein [Mangrovactinospora gilvigrisea]|uniref:Ferric nitrobindin-like protein n=1 Tax=Mangrovactinospora gilvigrisea TaxID=1428644 RepID=A0A1J7CDR2_9ACTN|nr:FABP family protein [Mangrovactinospora gilvigrisea]OIV37802.1 FABP family protein [Mangrovactinospora gilvigrisea]
MLEIPEDLDPSLVPLAFLLGTWEGAGVADLSAAGGDPEATSVNFGQEVTFSQDGRAVLEYSSHTWELGESGRKVRPIDSEHGYWRFAPDARTVEITMTRDDGTIEIWYGNLADKKPQIDLVTDAVARIPSAPAYTGGKRLYGLVGGDLMWVFERAADKQALKPFMSAQLRKVPENGLAFHP